MKYNISTNEIHLKKLYILWLNKNNDVNSQITPALRKVFERKKKKEERQIIEDRRRLKKKEKGQIIVDRRKLWKNKLKNYKKN